MLICNNRLDKVQLNAVDNLVTLCSIADDGNAPIVYRHLLIEERLQNNNILYYQNERLIGFLSVYFFYEDACEASLLVDPLYRRQGIAKQVLKQIVPLLIKTNMQRVIFSTAADKKYVWLTQMGFYYHTSEYHMQRQSSSPILIDQPKLLVHPATKDQVPDLLAIDAACFSTSRSSDMSQRFHSLLNNPQYSLFLAFYQQSPVGKVHLLWLRNGTILSDLAILPAYQNQGLGSELLAWCINQALAKQQDKPLELDVETTNHHALQLYTKYNFAVVTANDFWAIPIDRLILLF